MVNEALAANRLDLVKALEESRVKIAQGYAWKAAVGGAENRVDPFVIGKMWDKVNNPDNITGPLRTIGQLVIEMPGVFGQVSANAEKTSITNRIAMAGAGAAGGAAGFNLGGVGGAMVAAPLSAAAVGQIGKIPSYLARQVAGSSPYQQFMTRPSYGTNAPDLMQNALRFSSQSLGR
jgi:hypothetical protein